MLNDAYDIFAFGSGNITLDGLKEFFGSQSGGQFIARCNRGDNRVFVSLVQSGYIICPYTAVKLYNRNLFVKRLSKAVHKAFSNGSQYYSSRIVVQRGTYHFLLRWQILSGLACRALERYLVPVFLAGSNRTGLNGLPKSMGLAFCNNGDGLARFGRLAARCQARYQQCNYAKDRDSDFFEQFHSWFLLKKIFLVLRQTPIWESDLLELRLRFCGFSLCIVICRLCRRFFLSQRFDLYFPLFNG